MSLIKLTAIPHPDLNGGKPYPVYVDHTHIVLIELTKTSQQRYGWREQAHALVCSFWDEVQRVDGELQASAPQKMVPDSEEEAERIGKDLKRWTQRKDIAASIHAAFGIMNQQQQTPQFHPPVECTCIQLSVPNAQFAMLPAVYVTESPDQVAEMVSY